MFFEPSMSLWKTKILEVVVYFLITSIEGIVIDRTFSLSHALSTQTVSPALGIFLLTGTIGENKFQI